MNKKAPSKKADNNNTPVKYSLNTGGWLQDIELVMQRIESPFTEENAKEVASCLLRWSIEENAYTFDQFCDVMGITSHSYQKRVKRSPILKAAHQIAKQRLGIRQRLKATFKESNVDGSMVRPTLRFYDSDWDTKYKEEVALEDRRRKEDKEHQIKMQELKSKQEEAAKNALLDFFKTQVVQIPELNDKKRDPISTRSRKNSTEV